MVESKKEKKGFEIFTQGIFPENFVVIRQSVYELWSVTDDDDDADDADDDDDDNDGRKVTA